VARYFVIWCMGDDVEEAIDAPARHGELVGHPKVSRHITGGYAASAEISPHEEDIRSEHG